MLSWEACVQLWYLFYLGSQVSVYPFLVAWFAVEDGPGPLTPRQLGYVGCARPWIMVPSSFLWGMLADRLNAHRAILIGCLISATAVRCLLYWSEGFVQIMTLMLLMQVLSSPVMMLADAKVNAACTKEGDYGKLRKSGAIGWGLMSFVSGAFIDAFGMKAAFILHVLLIFPCLHFAWVVCDKQDHSERVEGGDIEIGKADSSDSRQYSEGSDKTHVSQVNGAVSGSHQQQQQQQQQQNGGLVDPKQGQQRRRVDELIQTHVRNGVKGVKGVSRRQKKCDAKRQKAKDWRSRQSLQSVQEAEREGSLTLSGPEDAASECCAKDAEAEELVGSSGNEAESETCCDSLSDDGSTGGGGEQEQQMLLGHHGSLSHHQHQQQLQQQHPHQPQQQLQQQQQQHGEGARVHFLTPQTYKQVPGGSVAHAPQVPGKEGAPPTFSEKLKAMLGSVHIVLFLLQAILFGYGFGTIESFLFVFLQDLGAKSTLMGLTLTITCMAEVPIFQYTGALVSKFGAPRLLQFSVVCYAVRMYAYALLPKVGVVWAVLPVEVLHGITFGLCWCVGTTMCRRLAPPGMKATMQALFQACYFGFGYGCGALVGGFLSHEYGFPAMFAISATVICGFGSAIQFARCLAPPSPYDLNPDEGEGHTPSQGVLDTHQREEARPGSEGQAMSWGQRLKAWLGFGRASNADYVGVATAEQGQQNQQQQIRQ